MRRNRTNFAPLILAGLPLILCLLVANVNISFVTTSQTITVTSSNGCKFDVSGDGRSFGGMTHSPSCKNH